MLCAHSMRTATFAAGACGSCLNRGGLCCVRYSHHRRRIQRVGERCRLHARHRLRWRSPQRDVRPSSPLFRIPQPSSVDSAQLTFSGQGRAVSIRRRYECGDPPAAAACTVEVLGVQIIPRTESPSEQPTFMPTVPSGFPTVAPTRRPTRGARCRACEPPLSGRSAHAE